MTYPPHKPHPHHNPLVWPSRGGDYPWPILSLAAAEQLDFFCFLGDTIYADWGANVGHEEKWKEALTRSGLQDLTASTSVIATWDDHEVDNNWSYDWISEQTVSEALTAMRRAMPMRVGPGGTGLWRSMSWGDAVEVFVLDCRGERRDGDYISAEQQAWLIDGLTTSTAAFKIVLNSVAITDLSDLIGNIEADDRWQGHKAQRSEILEAVADVRGVLWIAGDFHFGLAADGVDVDGPGEGHFEVLAGPGGTAVIEYASLFSPTDHYPVVVTEINYLLGVADPDAGTIAMQWINQSGGISAEVTARW